MKTFSDWLKGFITSAISNPDYKIATDLGNKATIDNRNATRVISSTGPHPII